MPGLVLLRLFKEENLSHFLFNTLLKICMSIYPLNISPEFEVVLANPGLVLIEFLNWNF